MRNIKWVSLIEESKPNVPKFVPISNNKLDPKVKIIQDYILEKTTSVLFSESNSGKNHEFFTNNASWDDFENHARMIAQFIEKKDQDKINKAIDKIKQAFITLGSFQDKDPGIHQGCTDSGGYLSQRDTEVMHIRITSGLFSEVLPYSGELFGF